MLPGNSKVSPEGIMSFVQFDDALEDPDAWLRRFCNSFFFHEDFSTRRSQAHVLSIVADELFH